MIVKIRYLAILLIFIASTVSTLVGSDNDPDYSPQIDKLADTFVTALNNEQFRAAADLFLYSPRSSYAERKASTSETARRLELYSHEFGKITKLNSATYNSTHESLKPLEQEKHEIYLDGVEGIYLLTVRVDQVVQIPVLYEKLGHGYLSLHVKMDDDGASIHTLIFQFPRLKSDPYALQQMLEEVNAGISNISEGETVRFFELTEKPQTTKKASARFPEFAADAGVEGEVSVKVLVGTHGKVEKIEVLKSVPRVNRAAVEAALNWEFTPAKIDGTPVKVWMQIPFTFAYKTRGKGSTIKYE